MCNQSYILHIDADETIPKLLLDIIIDNLNNNITIDMIGIPRINKIIIDDNTITIEEIFGPNALDGKNRINWPDYQWRLLKNDQSVIWQGKIHEMPSGQTRGVLPESEQIAIQHIKNISKQLHQKNDYIKRWNNKR